MELKICSSTSRLLPNILSYSIMLYQIFKPFEDVSWTHFVFSKRHLHIEHNEIKKYKLGNRGLFAKQSSLFMSI